MFGDMMGMINKIKETQKKVEETKEGVKEDFINTELNKSIDELYGKPYDEKKTGECDKYIYKLIPEAKGEIDKIVKSGIY